MVFTSAALFIRQRGPDEFWRKRKIFKLASHFVGRRRNCYSIAIRYVHRALVYATKGRQLKKADIKELREQRIEAAAQEQGTTLNTLGESLARAGVLLNRKSLADLAIWEPFSFRALTQLAAVDPPLESTT